LHSETGLSQHDLDAEAFDRALGIGREILREARQHAAARLRSGSPALAGVDIAKVRRHRDMRELRDGAGKFDPGRAGADDHECQPRGTTLRIGLAARRARRPSESGAGLVVASSSVFSPGANGFPFIVAEIGMACAGGEHQRVIGQGIAAVELHAPRCDIDNQ